MGVGVVALEGSWSGSVCNNRGCAAKLCFLHAGMHAQACTHNRVLQNILCASPSSSYKAQRERPFVPPPPPPPPHAHVPLSPGTSVPTWSATLRGNTPTSVCSTLNMPMRVLSDLSPSCRAAAFMRGGTSATSSCRGEAGSLGSCRADTTPTCRVCVEEGGRRTGGGKGGRGRKRMGLCCCLRLDGCAGVTHREKGPGFADAFCYSIHCECVGDKGGKTVWQLWASTSHTAPPLAGAPENTRPGPFCLLSFSPSLCHTDTSTHTCLMSALMAPNMSAFTLSSRSLKRDTSSDDALLYTSDT